MKVVVTGGTGFVGQHLCRRFAEEGWDVLAVDVNSPEGGSEQAFARCDVTRTVEVERACRGADVIVNNAALVPVTRSTLERYRQVNVGGTENVLRVARESGAYVLHVSSSAIYGAPTHVPITPATPFAPFEPYGQSKAEAEMIVRRFRGSGSVIGTLRPRALVGDGRVGILAVIFGRIRDDRLVPIIGSGDNLEQTSSVADFAEAAVCTIRHRATGDYLIGARVFGTVRQDLEELISRVGSRSRVVGVPHAAVMAASVPLKALGISPLTDWHYRTAHLPFFFDIEASCAELAWEPQFSSVDALVDAYESFLERGVGSSPHRRPLEGFIARLLQ
jgi:nucleoside-diphosphate-sugar epimerase